MDSKQNNIEYVGIALHLPRRYMDLLTHSATASVRPKNKDAAIRLMDHLDRYAYIAKVGTVTVRDGGIDE